MHQDAISCVLCTSNEVEYLEKERSYKNSTKEVNALEEKDKILLRSHFNVIPPAS